MSAEPLAVSLWRSELYPYQVKVLDDLKDLPGSALYLDMGLGKTVITISLMEYWYSKGLRRFVYLCQNGLRQSMADEFAKWSSPLRVVVLEPGNRAKRVAQIKSQWDVLVVNYEASRTLWQEIVRMRPQALAIDECQSVKHRTSAQSKAARKIAMATKILGGHRVLMSGTPITKDVLDLWSEIDIMEPFDNQQDHLLGFGSYKAYERAVAVLTPHPRLGMRAPFKKFKPEEVSKVTARMASFARVLRARDVLPDLPPQRFDIIRLEMTETQRAIYKALKEDMIAVLNEKDLPEATDELMKHYGIGRLRVTPEDLTVTSTLTTVLLLRLQQITSGFVKTESGVLLSIPSIKHTWMEDYLPELTDTFDDRKCVIFTRFIHDIDSLMKVCEGLNIGAVRLDGKTSRDAADIVRKFQTDPGVRALVGNIQVAATGFTMTAADNEVFFSNGYRYEQREQAIKRIHRIGQTRPVTYRDLACAPVDFAILRNLSEKQDIAVNTLAELRNLVESL